MNKTILITGASSGIGKATVKHFQAKGWNVAATMRNPADGEDLGAFDNVLVTSLDVTDASSIHSAVKQTLDTFGSIDVLVNNAGYGNGGVLEAVPMENFRRQFEVNVFGVVETIKAVLPIMRKNKSGTIVNISSIGGRVTIPFFSPYHGTKWAVEGITEALQYELDPIGIKVRIVEPGAIKTDFAGRSLDFINDENLSEYQPTFNQFMATMADAGNRGAEPEIVAEVIDQAIHGDKLRYLAGEDAKAIIDLRNQVSDQVYLDTAKERFGLKS